MTKLTNDAVKNRIIKTELVDISKLTPFQGKLKTLDDKNFNKLRKSIIDEGFSFTVHVWENGGVTYIIDGHQRVSVLTQMRKQGIEVPPISCSYVSAKTYRDAKKLVLLAVSQYGKIQKDGFLEFVEGEDFDFEDFDFPDLTFDLDGIFDAKPESSFDESKEDEIPDEAPTLTRLGDIWQLGNHRLMCGDSTDLKDVSRLMEKNRAAMVFTDPPYNIDYGNIIHPKFKQREIQNDNMSGSDFKKFCQGFARSIAEYCDGCVYVFGPPGVDGRIMFTVLDETFHCSTTIVWNKDQFTLGRGKYQNKYEPCWFGWTKDGSSFTDDRTLTNVWDIARPKKSELHPTMKPVEIVERAMNHASKKGDIVMELFCGSGTTIVAAEKTGRRCFGMELDEKYCDIIIARWENLTGKKAERVSSGR